MAPPPAMQQMSVPHEATNKTIAISDTAQGYTFDSSMLERPADQEYRFRILRPDGARLMTYLWDQIKLLHFLAVRNDFTGFAHVHPTLASDGTWSVRLPLAQPGPYQLYVDFLLKDALGLPRHLVLRRPLTPGVPGPSMTGEADGYRITFLQQPKPWTVMLPAPVTRDDGTPVTNLEPTCPSSPPSRPSISRTTSVVTPVHWITRAPAARAGRPSPPSGRTDPHLPRRVPGPWRLPRVRGVPDRRQLHTAALTLHVQ